MTARRYYERGTQTPRRRRPLFLVRPPHVAHAPSHLNAEQIKKWAYDLADYGQREQVYVQIKPEDDSLAATLAVEHAEFFLAQRLYARFTAAHPNIAYLLTHQSKRR